MCGVGVRVCRHAAGQQQGVGTASDKVSEDTSQKRHISQAWTVLSQQPFRGVQ